MKNKILLLVGLSTLLFASPAVRAEAPTPEVQSKIDSLLKDMQQWAADPIVVNAVKAQNASLPATYAEVTQEKWTALSVLDPFVRGFAKNEAGVFLKSKKTDAVGEVFLSDASGNKVAFLSKTTSWNHKGKPKHDEPMSGKSWQGPLEVDASTGLMMVQASVPVLDAGKPIGSLVVGIKAGK